MWWTYVLWSREIKAKFPLAALIITSCQFTVMGIVYVLYIAEILLVICTATTVISDALSVYKVVLIHIHELCR